MYKQEFERSVQQKMEELSFAPSAPVWDKVAHKLQSEKKRRRFLLWLVPAAVMVLAVGYAVVNNTTIFQNKKALSENNASYQTPNHQNKISNTNTSSGKKSGAVNESLVTGTEGQKAYFKKEPSPSQQKAATQTLPANNKAVQYQATFVPEQNAFAAQTAQMGVQQNETSEPLRTIHKATAIPLLSVMRLHALQQVQTTQAISPIPVPALPKSKPAARWLWTADAQFGKANIIQPIFSASKNTGPLNDPASNPGTSWGNQARPTLQTKPGSFITAAFGLQRNTNKGFSIATGLRYSAYTQRLRVGEKINPSNFVLNGASADAFTSSVFFKPDTLRSYFKSRYQQLSVPLVLSTQPFKKWPLETEAGLAVGYLRAGKALRYDTAARIYYAYKPAIKPFQLQAQAALKYPLIKKGNWQWLAVAQMHYHLTGLYDVDQGKKRLYAWSAGLQLRKK